MTPSEKTKKQPGSPMADIAKPKKRTAPASSIPAPQLVIPKRAIMVPVLAAEADTPDPAPEPIAAVPSSKPLQPAPAAPAKVEAMQPSTPSDPDIASETQPEEVVPADDEQSPPVAQSMADPKPPTSVNQQDVRKALDEAKRQQEIQKYITNREFFVPVNAVARKRSLKVSGALVILELALGIFLLNLMLDAGVIDLLDKIPHTHFFDIR